MNNKYKTFKRSVYATAHPPYREVKMNEGFYKKGGNHD